MAYVYYPYTTPSAQFKTLAEAHQFIDTCGLPWQWFTAPIGTFVVRKCTRTGAVKLYTHFFPWQRKNRAIQKRYPSRFVQILNK